MIAIFLVQLCQFSPTSCVPFQSLFNVCGQCLPNALFNKQLAGNKQKIVLLDDEWLYKSGCKKFISLSSKLKLKKALSKAKVNSFYYDQNILKPIFEEEIPVIYGKDINKVKLHMNKDPTTLLSQLLHMQRKQNPI